MKLIQDLGILNKTISSPSGKRFGIYECPFCGNNFKAYSCHIKSGHTKSCGCYIKTSASDRFTKHGLRGSELYSKWANLKNRCLNPNDTYYNDYGNRGIDINNEWENSFIKFYKWALENGYKVGLQIDRIDVNRGYYPDNCRFVTPSVNAQNKRLLFKNNTSGYRGVSFHKHHHVWVASIRSNGKLHSLGTFKNKESAAKAYNKFVIENKTFHPLNIITKS